MSGGIGNLIDRISLGYVVDFIDVRIINFAIFNIADMCITIGAVLLCVAVFLSEKKEKTEKEKSSKPKTKTARKKQKKQKKEESR